MQHSDLWKEIAILLQLKQITICLGEEIQSSVYTVLATLIITLDSVATE